MSARRLTVLQPLNGPTTGTDEPGCKPNGTPAGIAATKNAGQLGVLSVHFEGGRCRVNCPFCYLGQRVGAVAAADAVRGPSDAPSSLDMNLVADALSALDYRELAVTLSEPIEPVLEPLLRLLRTASARGRKVAITTTLTLADRMVRERSAPSMAALLGSVFRINLSVDPWKGQVSPPKAMSLGRSGMGQVDIAELAALLSALQKSSGAERVLIATLSTPRFAEQLLEGPTSLLASLLDLQEVDRIALNGLKPPPPWCDRAFWLRALAGLAPLLRRYLDRKLFLDCYVAARILGVGGCPARPDLSPPPPEAPAGVAFRSCVYQPAPDFVVQSSAELGARLAGFSPPAVCPFPIR